MAQRRVRRAPRWLMLLCFGVAAITVAAYPLMMFRHVAVARQARVWFYSLTLQNGVLRLIIAGDGTRVPAAWVGKWDWYVTSRADDAESFDRPMLWWVRSRRIPGIRRYDVPVWMIGAPALAAGLGCLYSRRRREAGVCQSCGYSLADLPSTTCPECGTEAPPSR